VLPLNVQNPDRLRRVFKPKSGAGGGATFERADSTAMAFAGKEELAATYSAIHPEGFRPGLE